LSTAVILIVEDDPALRLLTQKQLALHGYKTAAVASGEQAVAYDRKDILLIFMDIGLPGINGIEATLQIREKERREGCRPVPIVALTAHSNRDECLLSGMNDFLQKPARLADIKRMIDRWLGRP
jgi:two-component system, sensor histidine kinase